MEHQKKNVIARSKKTTTMPTRLLVTLTSLPPNLIDVDSQSAITAYCQEETLA